MANANTAIGIDGGTYNACVAAERNGAVEVIESAEGSRTTASCVAFTDTERLVGDSARRQGPDNAANTVFGAKRILGMKFDDFILQEYRKNWPFKLVSDSNGRAQIEVVFERKRMRYRPEEILQMVFEKLRRDATEKLGPVTNAVIAVPAKFDATQRRLTIEAAEKAGLNVMRLISEPTAAAIAYGATQLGDAPRTILVFDLGAGTLDVSVVRVAGCRFQVLASAGNLHLGGEDFDDRLLNHFAGEFHANTGKDIRNNPKALARLRATCERAKRTLSSKSEAKMEIESLVDSNSFSATVTRALFEDLCIERFQAAILEVERALADATMSHGVAKKDIDHVLLAGGSAKIPKIQQLLSECFGGKQLNKSLDSDETIARGAAIYASCLSGNTSPAIRAVSLSDVVPLSLCVAYGKGMEMRVIIPRNTPRPAENMHVFRTHYADDRKRDVAIEIYAGERPLAKDNHRLGQVTLIGIKPSPEGTPQIAVTFSVDAHNVLSVTVLDLESNVSNELTIALDDVHLSKENVSRCVEEAEHHREVDGEMWRKVAARNALKSYSNQVQASMKNAKSKLDVAFELLSEKEVASEQDYKDLLADLQSAWRPVTHESPANAQAPMNANGVPQPGAPVGQPNANVPAGVLIEEVLHDDRNQGRPHDHPAALAHGTPLAGLFVNFVVALVATLIVSHFMF